MPNATASDASAACSTNATMTRISDRITASPLASARHSKHRVRVSLPLRSPRPFSELQALLEERQVLPKQASGLATRGLRLPSARPQVLETDFVGLLAVAQAR